MICISQVNEDTKANVSDLHEKLTKVSNDSEKRIKEFQEKLNKVFVTFDLVAKYVFRQADIW